MSIAFHNKYRPRHLDQIIGHEKAVARMKGMIASKNFPSAMLIMGPTSSGKTTLARCFAADVNEVKTIDSSPDYLEINAAESRGIDDIRQLLDISKLNPQRGIRRFLIIDEAHQLTGAAAQAVLKPLENAPKKTIFILCSMEPEKFASGTGRAIANRCTQFILEQHNKENIVRQLKRITKHEELKYVTEELLGKIADNAAGEMRTACNLLEALTQYVASLDEIPNKISDKDLSEVLATTETKDDEVAIRIMLGVYSKKFSYVQKSLLDATDSFGLINKMIWLNSFMLNNYVLKGERHPKVWWTKHNGDLLKRTKALIEKQPELNDKQLATYAATQSTLVRLRQQASSFLVPEQNLIGAHLYELIKELKRDIS
jgi:DNA polymerase-3 subunit gamma/tau